MKKVALKPKAALAQTSSEKTKEESPDKDTLLTLSTDVAEAAADPDDSQNLQLSDNEEKPLIAA
jgi:L-aminopeptidase/D-esterase-like protein